MLVSSIEKDTVSTIETPCVKKLLSHQVYLFSISTTAFIFEQTCGGDEKNFFQFNVQ